MIVYKFAKKINRIYTTIKKEKNQRTIICKQARLSQKAYQCLEMRICKTYEEKRS